MMKVLITGANGQLGSELKDLLTLESGYECYFLDRKQLPLDQILIIQDILSMYQPDIILNAAAYTSVDKAESDQEMADKVNHLACEEIAQYCRINNVKLISISTDYVFNGTSSIPIKEDEETDPINYYGLSKLNGENAILKWCPDAIIIRTSWVYSTYGNNFVKTMIRLMAEKNQISVINDQIGSPTYARDLAEAIITILKSNNWVSGIYNYSNEGEISWYDFAVEIKKILNLNCEIIPIPTVQYPTPAERPRFSLLDKAKIKEIYKLNIPQWNESLKGMLVKLINITN